MWHKATGPARALLATAGRVGWQILDSTTFVDDVGTVFHLEHDPPIRIILAARGSVHHHAEGPRIPWVCHIFSIRGQPFFASSFIHV